MVSDHTRRTNQLKSATTALRSRRIETDNVDIDGLDGASTRLLLALSQLQLINTSFRLRAQIDMIAPFVRSSPDN